MKSSDIYFCIHSEKERMSFSNEEKRFLTEEQIHAYENEHVMFVTLCSIKYWENHKCLPDTYWAQEVEKLFPSEYKMYPYSEECSLTVRKNKEEIRKELSLLGFVENKEMEEFLTDCWE